MNIHGKIINTVKALVIVFWASEIYAKLKCGPRYSKICPFLNLFLECRGFWRVSHIPLPKFTCIRYEWYLGISFCHNSAIFGTKFCGNSKTNNFNCSTVQLFGHTKSHVWLWGHEAYFSMKFTFRFWYFGPVFAGKRATEGLGSRIRTKTLAHWTDVLNHSLSKNDPHKLLGRDID